MAERRVLSRVMEAIGSVVMSAVAMADAGLHSREAVMADQGGTGAPAGGETVVVDVAGSAAAMSATVVKRKRGRPRKTEAVENQPSPVSAPAAMQQEKRGRGRPKGSGKRQLLACSGGDVTETMGEDFKIQVATVHIGEDIVNKILSFSQSNESVCMVSATGAVSSVVLRQPGSSGGILRFEGIFEILSLKGLLSSGGGVAGASRRPNILSVVLAKPDGRVFGGAVTGPLIAGGPIQLVVGTFKETVMKERKMGRPRKTPAPAAPVVAGNLGEEFANSANDINGMGMLGDGTHEMPTSARLESMLDAVEDRTPQNN